MRRLGAAVAVFGLAAACQPVGQLMDDLEFAGAGRAPGRKLVVLPDTVWKRESCEARPLTAVRFIPNREGIDLQASYSLLHADASPSTPSKPKKRPQQGELHFQRSEWRHFPPSGRPMAVAMAMTMAVAEKWFVRM